MSKLSVLTALAAVLALTGASHAFFADNFDGGIAGAEVAGNNGWVAIHEETSPVMSSSGYDAVNRIGSTGFGASGVIAGNRNGIGRDITADVVGDTATGEYTVRVSVLPSANTIMVLGDRESILAPDGDFEAFTGFWVQDVAITNKQVGEVPTTHHSDNPLTQPTTFNRFQVGWYEIRVDIDMDGGTGGAGLATFFARDVNDNTGSPIGAFENLGSQESISFTNIEAVGLFGNTPAAFDNFVSGVVPTGPPPTDFTWNKASGDWNTSTNWDPATRLPGQGFDRSSHTVTFGDSIGSDTRTVFTDEAVTVNKISFANTLGGSYRIAGGPSINLVASTFADMTDPSMDVQQGLHRFQAAVNVQSNATFDVAVDSTLIFDGALDLMGNTLTKSGAGTMSIRNVFVTGGGTLDVAEGIVSGNGTVGGDLNNGGTIAPGNSPGTLTDEGNLTDGAGGTIAAAGNGAEGSVPEPSSLVLLILGLVVITKLRHAHHLRPPFAG